MSASTAILDSIEFAETFLSVQNKFKQTVPLKLNSIQRKLVQNLSGRDLVLKPRQVGVSTITQALIFHRLITSPQTVLTLSHHSDPTVNLRERQDFFWKTMAVPDKYRPKRHYSNATMTTFTEYGSRHTIVTAGSADAIRSDALTFAHLTEYAFYPDPAAILTALSPMLNGPIVLESTPNGAQGDFYEKVKEAMDGNTSYRLHFFPWWDFDEYRMALDEGEHFEPLDEVETQLGQEQIKWRRHMQGELKHKFLQEYPEDLHSCFLRSGSGYFGDISHKFSAVLNAEPDPDHKYYAGLDWGQKKDFTVLVIIDRNTSQMVACYRWNQMEYTEMRRRVVEACKYWNVRYLCAETNSVGSVNIENLHSEAKAAGAKFYIEEFTTTNQSKGEIISSLYDGLHKGPLCLLPLKEVQGEFNAFATKQTPSNLWKFEAPQGEHDDIVMATAFAWHICDWRYRPA